MALIPSDNRSMRKLLFLISFLVSLSSLFAAPDMLIRQQDIVVEAGNAPGTTEASMENEKKPGFEVQGVHIYIRKKNGIESVMLVETTKDPEGKEANYSYRALEYNSINGDEIRYLDGKVLESKYGKYSLLCSTVTTHPQLGECFHIYIPPVVEYGYPWSRHGTVSIGKGMFINIRTFEKKYGDYTGSFADNPFMFDFAKVARKPKAPEPEKEPEPLPEPEPEPVKPAALTLTDDYSPEAAEKFKEIAADGGGLLRFSKGPETIAEDLLEAVDAINPKQIVDVVFAIDTTGSMKDDMQTLRTKWIPQFMEQLKEFDDIRIGLIFYRDYNGDYNYRRLPVKQFDFTSDFTKFKKNLNSTVIHGNEGGDVPEAVYEALYASMEFFDWRSDAQKKIILIGDAEPHPKPRGDKSINKDRIKQMAEEKNIILDCIIVPDDKAVSRGR